MQRYSITSEGMIPFKKHPELNILMPVKFQTYPHGNGHKLVTGKVSNDGLTHDQPAPLRCNGQLVYALPGGGDYLEA